jgi:hypothetical protein
MSRREYKSLSWISRRLKPGITVLAKTSSSVIDRPTNKVVRTIGNPPRCTPVRDLYTALNLPYVYDYIIEFCRQQAEVIQNHENDHVRSIEQGEARHRKYKKLKVGGGEAYDHSSDKAAVVA